MLPDQGTLAGIYHFRGGFPLTAVDATDYSGTNSCDERANCIGPVQYEKLRTIAGIQWVNPDTCANSDNGIFGTSGVSTLRGPGLDDVALSLQRDFPTFEGQKLEFRAEATTRSITPSSTRRTGTAQDLRARAACSAGYSVISSTQAKRNLQIALKYDF